MFGWMSGTGSNGNNSNNNNNNSNNGPNRGHQSAATKIPKRKKTRTGQSASKRKLKKLKTREEVRKMNADHRLPEDWKQISEGTFAEMSRITDDLYLTGIYGLTRENFTDNNITNVINATYEAPDIDIRGITCTRVLADDDAAEDLSEFFDPVSDNIDSMARSGRHTVVHCVAGVSRSAALVLAYLMKYKNMSLRDAFKHVVDRRRCAKPVVGFMRQLMAYEKRVRGSNSCQMADYRARGVTVTVPDFWIREYPLFVNLEVEAERQRLSQQSRGHTSSVESQIGSGYQ